MSAPLFDAPCERLHMLPRPDNESTAFFFALLSAQNLKSEAIARKAMWADHQRLQSRLTDVMQAFERHRACHALEFAVVLARFGEGHARAYLADIGHWSHELHRLILPEASAVPAKRLFL